MAQLKDTTVAGTLKVTGTTRVDGGLYRGSTNPSSSHTTRLNYSGSFYAAKVHNAVWNDIADFIEIGEDTEIVYGKAYFRNKSGDIYITDRKRTSLGIASDTYGFGVGENSRKRQIPIAIGGWVLAYVKESYKAGTPLVAGKNGVLVRARLKDRVLHPERIIAIFDRVGEGETWNGVPVNNRYWVKVK